MNTLEKQLMRKFREAEKAETLKKSKREKEINQELLSEEESEFEVHKPKRISVAEAEKISQLKQKLMSEFQTQHRREVEEIEDLEKRYKPITKAIKENTSTEIVPIPPMFASSTPKPNRMIKFDDESDYDIEYSSSLGPPNSAEKESFKQNKSAKQLMGVKYKTIGDIASVYLKRPNDHRFGIWVDEDMDEFRIGSEVIDIEYDDIIIRESQKRYEGTEGLWRLLTKNDYFAQEGMYTDGDWENYKDILIRTHSLYQRNDPNSGKPKSSVGRKWKGMIKKIWEEYKRTKEDSDTSGSGLAQYNENPIEYKYISNLNELTRRLAYIHAQETAGNNNFHNEKLALAKFLGDRLEELIETPKGVKYLLRCLSVLPESMIEGSGLLNDIINNLPFELHWPRMRFLGPGTKLEKRLKRGDKGINPLDEAAKEHDIWYRDHKNTEDRWEADKTLQKKAWERVVSKDADLIEERLPALVTTGAMWAKRKLGMGLSTSSYVYPD